LEIIVATITKDDQSKRKKWTWIIGLSIFLVGIPSALSYGILSDFTIFGKTFFDLSDFLVSNVLLPLGALAIAIFASRKIPKKVLLEEISAGNKNNKKLFAIWLLLIKYIAPVAIIIVFLDVLGVFKIIGLFR